MGHITLKYNTLTNVCIVLTPSLCVFRIFQEESLSSCKLGSLEVGRKNTGAATYLPMVSCQELFQKLLVWQELTFNLANENFTEAEKGQWRWEGGTGAWLLEGWRKKEGVDHDLGKNNRHHKQQCWYPCYGERWWYLPVPWEPRTCHMNCNMDFPFILCLISIESYFVYISVPFLYPNSGIHPLLIKCQNYGLIPSPQNFASLW